MTNAPTLPPGTFYRVNGRKRKMRFEAKLIYHWGKKGSCGMEAVAWYYVPIFGGHVGIYVLPKDIL